jgi:hypothetical protein
METCPMCGFSEKPKGLMPSSVMNQYVNKDNPKDIVIQNSEDKEIIHKSKVEGKADVVYVRADLVVGSTKSAESSKPSTPITPNKVDAFGNAIPAPSPSK